MQRALKERVWTTGQEVDDRGERNDRHQGLQHRSATHTYRSTGAGGTSKIKIFTT